MSLMKKVISEHARFELARRQLTEEMVIAVVANPGQTLETERGRTVYQTRYFDASVKRDMLLRVVCEHGQDSITVIPAYRTSKIEKYWEQEG